MKVIKQSIFALFLCCASLKSYSFAQVWTNKNIGFQLGLVFNLGTAVNQFGYNLSAFGRYEFIQINLGNSSTFSFTNLANRKKMFENRFSVGALILGGKKNSPIDFKWDVSRHKSNHNNAIGYNYIWYRDNKMSSQTSGGWTVQFSAFKLFFENDIFAGTGRDKFRTGHLLLEYQREEHSAQVGLKLWTGETKGSPWIKESHEKRPSGYRILRDLPFGKTSHGILYAGIMHRLPHGNSVSYHVGADAEKVRHIFQNRISHDLVFLPKAIIRKTPHYPMLKTNGDPSIDNLEIRKTRFYAQIGTNLIWSY